MLRHTLETNSSFHSIVFYQAMTVYRSVDATSTLELEIPICSGSAIQASSCVERSTLYEVVVTANVDANINIVLEADLELASFPQLGMALGHPLVTGVHFERITSEQAILDWFNTGSNSTTVVQLWSADMLYSAILNHSINLDGARSATIRDCFPGSELCIRPFQRYGVSLTSLNEKQTNVEMIYFETAETVPTSIVRDVTHTIRGSRYNILTFILPIKSNGFILHLYIDAFIGDKLSRQLQLPINSSAYQQRTQPNSTYSLTVVNLKPFTEYRLALRAANSKGAGPSTTILATTAEDVPSSPRNPTLSPTVSLDGQLELHWQSPMPSNGLILEYELMVSSSMFDLNVTLPSNATSTKVTLATEDDKVLLRARTSVGWGPWSEPAIFAQGSGSELAPGNITRSWIIHAGAAFALMIALAGFVLRRYKKHVSTNFRPVADEYEVLSEQVDIIDIIGYGAHGKVYKAVSVDSNR
jgi:hypothetical protein